MDFYSSDHLFKVVIIGDAGVGKSALLLRFADDQFNETYLTTLGVDFRFKSLQMEKANVKLQIWDTAGQERFRTITNAYYKGANGIVVAYDTTNQNSFQNIDKFWLNEVTQYAEPNIDMMLIGNKVDLTSDKQVQTGDAKAYAQSKGMFFQEVSAKSAQGVEEAFLNFTRQLIAKKEAAAESTPTGHQRLRQNRTKEDRVQEKKCC